jgi:hypothetical protein
MSLQIEIPEPLAEKVEQAAQQQGRTATDVVLDAVAERLDPLARLRHLTAPIAERLEELGETEDDAVEFFEEVKHDLRRQRRNASP